MSSTKANQDEETKKNGIFSLLFGFVKINFYGVKILKDFLMYRKLAKMVKSEPFLKETANKHRRVGIALLIIHVVILSSPAILISKIEFTPNVDSLLTTTKIGKRLHTSFKPLRKADAFVSKYVSTFQKRKKGRELIILSFLALAIHTVVLATVRSLHPVEDWSKKLKNALVEEGIHQEDDGRLAIALPCGFYIDIAGHGAKEVSTRESLWKRLSVTIDDIKQYETPGDNTKVFFVRKFILKDTYNFS